jgi:hypothetical protein
MNTQTTPYRAIAFGSKQVTKGKGKRARVETQGYAFVLWNPENSHEPARLRESGSFLWPGIHAVRQAAVAAFDNPEIHQVSIRTNQDRHVYTFYRGRFNRHHYNQLSLLNSLEAL